MEPKIRLKKFSREWERTTFGDRLLSIQTGTNLLGNMDNKGIPLLKMGNIQRGYFSFDKLERLSESDKPTENCIVKYGDFFYNTRNTLELVGKGATWMEKKGVFAFNSNIARCTLEGINTFFFNYLYNTINVIKQVQARAKGTTSVAAVYQRDLDTIEFFLPSVDEQQALGAYFQHFDSLIQSTTKKIESLKQVKAASLQSMFPQEGETTPRVRFKGFKGEWEKKSLEECLTINNERNQNNVYGINDVLSVSDEVGVVNQIKLLGRSYAGKSVSNYRVLKKNQIVYTKSPLKSKPYGIVKVNKGSVGIVSVLYAVYDANENVNPDYIHYYFEPTHRINNYLLPLINKGAKNTMNISDEMALKGYIWIPSFDEQKKIADYLQVLDSQITLHSQQLEKLKQIKSACLDNMFV